MVKTLGGKDILFSLGVCVGQLRRRQVNVTEVSYTDTKGRPVSAVDLHQPTLMWLVPPNPFGPSHLRASACERVWYRVSSRSSFDLPASLKCSAEGQSRPVRLQHRIDFCLVHDDNNPSHAPQPSFVPTSLYFFHLHGIESKSSRRHGAEASNAGVCQESSDNAEVCGSGFLWIQPLTIQYSKWVGKTGSGPRTEPQQTKLSFATKTAPKEKKASPGSSKENNDPDTGA